MLNTRTLAYKALYFDLRIESLSTHYSNSNPTGGYAKIKEYLTAHNFKHEQYSGYHSNFRTTDMYIFELIYKMQDKFPWLAKCANRFAVMDVGENYNLMKILNDDPAALT